MYINCTKLPIILLNISIIFSFLFIEVATTGVTLKIIGHEIDYYARLNEDLVHSLSVKRIWSSARQGMLDEKAKKQKSAKIDEHDVTEKTNSLVELNTQFTVMVGKEIFKRMFDRFSREDQKWIMHEKKAGTFPDLEPDCFIDNADPSFPIICNLNFQSLYLVYGVSFELNAVMKTQSLNLTPEEIAERMQPSEKGTSRPIEYSNIHMTGSVVVPSNYTKNINDYELSLSEEILRYVIVKCNRFLATPLPIVSMTLKDEMDEVHVIDRNIWKKMVAEYEEYHKADESKEETFHDSFFSTPKPPDQIIIDVNQDSDNDDKSVQNNDIPPDHRSKEEKDGVLGLEDFMQSMDDQIDFQDDDDDDDDETNPSTQQHENTNECASDQIEEQPEYHKNFDHEEL